MISCLYVVFVVFLFPYSPRYPSSYMPPRAHPSLVTLNHPKPLFLGPENILPSLIKPVFFILLRKWWFSTCVPSYKPFLLKSCSYCLFHHSPSLEEEEYLPTLHDDSLLKRLPTRQASYVIEEQEGLSDRVYMFLRSKST